MKKLTILTLFLHSLLINGQCDVAITNVDLNNYEVTIEVINSEGCTANGPGGVDGAVTMLQIGYHLPEAIDPNNEVVDLLTLPDAPCSPQWVDNGWNLGMIENQYSGWWYSPTATVTFNPDLMGDGLVTGDVVVVPLNPPGDYVNTPYPLAECGDDLIDYWLSEDECIEFVVWQLNYGATWHTANGGWAETANGYVPNPSTYQDPNCNNSWYMCRDENPGAAVANPDFCEVILDECNDPIACNYNENWGELGGFCIYCDTPNGEELCEEYQNVGGYWDFYFNAFNCNNDYPGCTDPLALNYDEEATVDDGSCVYSMVGPDLIAIDMAITGQECLDDNQTHIVSYTLTVVNIGNEDVEEFCITTFLSQNQAQCPNFLLSEESFGFGDTILVNGSFQANWISGQNSYVELFNVIGPNNTPEVVTGNNNFVFSMPEFEECQFTDANPSELNLLTQCIDGTPQFKVNFGITNLGVDTLTNYCYVLEGSEGEILNQCVSSDGTYADNNDVYTILPGVTKFTTTGWLTPTNWCGDISLEVYNVGGESEGSNNFIEDFLPENPCPPEIDTVYVELPPDTITLIETEFVYDTTYIEIIDTLIVTNIDTLYVELPPDTITLTETEFVFITDTIYETELIYITDTLYITYTDTIIEYQFIEVDCATGLPCSELGFDQCEPLVVFIPNTFTPNNDGYNDVWEVVLDPECWAEVDVKIYNRWGDLMWESFDPYYVQWDGSYNNGAYYVADGVYYWTFTGRKINTTVIEDLQGHVTIFR